MIRCYKDQNKLDLELAGDLAALISGMKIEEEEVERMFCAENVDLGDYKSLHMLTLKQRSILGRLKIWEFVEN